MATSTDPIGFDDVAGAIGDGARTVREIAAGLGVPTDDPGFVAALNAMRHHQRIDFAGGCCTDSLEHSLDCVVELLAPATEDGGR